MKHAHTRTWATAAGSFLAAFLLLPGALAQSETPPVFLLTWGGPGEFASPHGVAVEAGGTILVADQGSSRVQRFTSEGVFLSQWPAEFPQDIDLDADGNVYTVHSLGLEKHTPGGTLLATWAGPGLGVAVDRVRGFVYTVFLNGVAKWSLNGDFLASWTAGVGGNFGEQNSGVDVGVNGDVYVMGGTSDVVRVFTSDGVPVREWAVPSGAKVGIGPDGRVYVTSQSRVRKYSDVGLLLLEWGTFGTGDGQFNGATGIDFGDDGSIYVVDTDNHRIQKFGDAPTPTTRATWGKIKSRYRR